MSPPQATSRRELKRIGHELRPLDIVVVNTSAGKRYGEPDYVPTGSGMGREATLYLHLARRQNNGHRRLVMGRSLRPHGQEICRDQECQADLGGSQVLAARLATATSRNCTTSKACRRTGSWSPASPSKSKLLPPVGPAPSPLSRSEQDSWSAEKSPQPLQERIRPTGAYTTLFCPRFYLLKSPGSIALCSASRDPTLLGSVSVEPTHRCAPEARARVAYDTLTLSVAGSCRCLA